MRRLAGIDVEIGALFILCAACIEQPEVINKILAHLITNKSAQIH
jgi:hypothetical protein